MTNSFRATRPQAKTIESLAWKNLTIENLKTGHPMFTRQVIPAQSLKTL